MKFSKLKITLISIAISIINLSCIILLIALVFSIGDNYSLSPIKKIIASIGLGIPFIILGFPLVVLAALIGIVFGTQGYLFPISVLLNSILCG
ncbi:MAG: hypothetical protein KKC11_05035 [Candidatus Omnitrophica bacterium]|nr:hypothetical protein [Candidatus Omnitrophota bacterium]MBU1133803.1 hypothetical protein [Candidatus Omnitrophota bacterium]